MSISLKSFSRDVFFIFFATACMFLLGWVPYGDVAQALFYFWMAFWARWQLYVSQSANEITDADRHRLVGEELFRLRMAENPYETQNILASGDIPLWLILDLIWDKVVETLGLSTDESNDLFDFEKLKKIEEAMPHIHAVDMFCHFGDGVGRGLIRCANFFQEKLRAGLTLSEIDKELLIILNQCWIHTGGGNSVVVINSKDGDLCPWSLSSHPLVYVFVGYYPIKRLDDGIIVSGEGVRVAFTPDKFSKEILEKFLEEFPMFQRENLGSGPQSRGLFIQENPSVLEKLDPEKILAKKVKAFWEENNK